MALGPKFFLITIPPVYFGPLYPKPEEKAIKIQAFHRRKNNSAQHTKKARGWFVAVTSPIPGIFLL